MGKKDVVVIEWPVPLGVLEQNGHPPSGKTKDSNGDEIDNGFLPQAADAVDGEIKAESIEDMVDKVIDSLRPGDCIRRLVLVGHGSPGNVSVGDGKLWQPDKHIDGNQSEWEGPLAKLCEHFCPDEDEIEVYLLGCSTGVCDKGAAKLHKLAHFFKDTCFKDTRRPHFRVFGTRKEIYASDVADVLEEWEDSDLLVSVSSTEDEVPACMAPEPVDPPKEKDKDGDKDGDKDKDRQDKDKDVPKDKDDDCKDQGTNWPRPDPRDFKAIGFRSVTSDHTGVTLKHPPRIDPKRFLELYDFDRAYEPAGLAAETDGWAQLVRHDDSVLQLELTLRGTALVYEHDGEGYLYLLKDRRRSKIVHDLLEGPCRC